MKIRKGFVSNSSSSSFVVAFPKGMEINETNVHNYLYGEKLTVVCAYSEGIRSEEAAARICQEMLAQTPNNEKELVDALGGWLEGAPEYKDYVSSECTAHRKDYCKEEACQTERSDAWTNYKKVCDDYQRSVLEKFKQDVGDGFDLYTFTFADDSGDPVQAILEHADTFRNANHIVVSNH